MASRVLERTLFLLAAASVCACATVDPQPDYRRARESVRAATGLAAVHDPEQPVLSATELAARLADGLGVEEATELALLENRRLHAGFLALGVARADYVQAGLLRNPSLSLELLFPEGGGRVRWAADLALSVTEIWQLPERQALAAAGVEQELLELTHFAAELVAATRRAYFEAVAARSGAEVASANHELARRTLDAVRRRVEAGVAERSEAGLAEGLALGAQLALHRAEQADAGSRRALAALLSLEADLTRVALTDALPAPDWPEHDPEALLQQSLERRADLRAARNSVAAAEAELALELRRRTPELEAGLAVERPEGGSSSDLLVGPVAALELPLFDQHQVRVRRAELELARRTKEHEALRAEAGQEVRAALARAAAAARAATFARAELLPGAERTAQGAERAYELGHSTVLTLLQARAAVLEARRSVLETALEAALARIEAQRVCAGALSWS